MGNSTLFVGLSVVLTVLVTQVCANATPQEDFDYGMILIREGAAVHDKKRIEREIIQFKKAANAGHAEAAYGLHYVYAGI